MAKLYDPLLDRRDPSEAGIWSDKRGSVAVIFALSLPLVVGMCALGLEVGVWQLEKARMQTAADAGAYAGALEAGGGGVYAAIKTAATNAATGNGFDDAIGDIEVNNPPKTGANINSKSIEVIVTRSQTRYFSQVFSDAPVIVRARAVAGYTIGSSSCILALHPSASSALSFSGNSSLTTTGCNVTANSNAAGAVHAQGSTSVKVNCISTAGTYTKNGNPSVTQTCGAALTGQPTVADPYASVPEPAVGTCASSAAATLNPGTYCGISVNSNTTKTFNPGTYVIKGGSLSFNGTSTVNGAGVTFFLTENATLSINGNSTLNLSAPTTGTYAGILFFGARSNSASTVTMNGNGTSVATGSLYFPAQTIDFKGNFTGTGGCMQMVASKVGWTGSTSMKFDCSAYGIKPITSTGATRLKE